MYISIYSHECMLGCHFLSLLGMFEHHNANLCNGWRKINPTIVGWIFDKLFLVYNLQASVFTKFHQFIFLTLIQVWIVRIWGQTFRRYTSKRLWQPSSSSNPHFVCTHGEAFGDRKLLPLLHLCQQLLESRWSCEHGVAWSHCSSVSQ